MRRTPAILLLALFSFALLTPAFAPDADGRLPECCRRAGKHHCSMPASGERTESGQTFAANRRCPLYPPIVLFSGVIAHAWVASASTLHRPDAGFLLNIRRERVLLAAARSGAHQKRGPPSLS